MGEPVRTPVGVMWVDEDGILWHRLDDGITVTADDATAVREAVLGLTGGEPIRALVDISGVGFADRKARDAFGSEWDANEIATAVVVGSAVSRTLGNLWLQLSKPARPVRLFSDHASALDWVKRV